MPKPGAIQTWWCARENSEQKFQYLVSRGGWYCTSCCQRWMTLAEYEALSKTAVEVTA